jgi:hypothetical protein
MGSLVFEEGGIEIWQTTKKNSKDGWIGVFNRDRVQKSTSIEQTKLGLKVGGQYSLFDVWNREVVSTLDFSIGPNGVIFLKYSENYICHTTMFCNWSPLKFSSTSRSKYETNLLLREKTRC